MNIGAIFDWDGVVIDSSAAHEESWERLAKEESRYLPPDHFKKGFGKKNQVIIPEMLQWTQDKDEIQRLGDRKEELYREIIKERGIEALPGVVELLEFFQRKTIPCVVGSSTPRLNIETIMNVIGLQGFFAGIIAAEDVDRGKPDPDVFLQGAALIERAPERCVVFEDAHHGIEAAQAGGMKCVGVATTHPIETLKGAHIRVKRLDELDRDELLGLW